MERHGELGRIKLKKQNMKKKVNQALRKPGGKRWNSNTSCITIITR